jgi:CheY-like chemotaxis protein
MAILVAAHPLGSQRLKKALAGRELSFVGTLEEAKRVLAQQTFSGVLLGIQFDDSRVLELLEHLRAQPKTAGIPVVCMIGIRGRLSGAALSAFAEAARALGAREVLDAADFADDPGGNAALREALERLMPASRTASSMQRW